MRKLTKPDWLARRGKRLYGPDFQKWKFRCVACGNVQSVELVKERNPSIEKPPTWVYFSCEGRQTEGVGCNWTLGGLLHFHQLVVVDDDGTEHAMFEFADDPAGDWTPIYLADGSLQPAAERTT